MRTKPLKGIVGGLLTLLLVLAPYSGTHGFMEAKSAPSLSKEKPEVGAAAVASRAMPPVVAEAGSTPAPFVETPESLNSILFSPLPTGSPNPTQAPGPVTASPYSVNHYYAQSRGVEGMVDGPATVRVYHEGRKIGEGIAERAGGFFVSLGTASYRVLSGEISITAQREGERESAPLTVAVLHPAGESRSPIVNPAHIGDFLLSGKSQPGAYILAMDSSNRWVEGGFSDSNGFFAIGFSNPLTKGTVLHVTATEPGKAASPQTDVKVEAASGQTPQTGTLAAEPLYAGPLVLHASSPQAVLLNVEGKGYSQSVTYGYGGDHVIFSPSLVVQAGQKMILTSQSPGKSPSGKVELTTKKAAGRTRTPLVKRLSSLSDLQVSTESGAFLYLKDASGRLMPTGRSEEIGSTERSLDLSEFPAGATYYVYAFVPGKLVSIPASVVIPPLKERLASPESADDLIEGTNTIRAKVEPQSLLKVYHWRAATGMLDLTSEQFSADGQASVQLLHHVEPGDRLILTASKSGFETSVALIKTVKEASGPSVSALQVDPVYNGDFLIGLHGSFDRVEITDDHQNHYVIDNRLGPYAFGHQMGMLGRPLPDNVTSLTLYVVQNGKKPIHQQVQVEPNEGQTEPVVLLSSTLYEGMNRIMLSAKYGDQVMITWRNCSWVQYAESTPVTYDMFGSAIRPKAGDSITITVKSRGKVATSATFPVQAAP
ncbi:Ig-like domain-containing protein [Gorillibacterium sp. sgz500922]|uniref:Ig-like domain-containing protein n=1 Tax=Gorillibacterium sp. sgz500922 TaxID=3446694 RepID=UPI003F66F444